MLRTTATWVNGPGTPFYTTMYWGGTTSGEAAFARTATRNYLNIFLPSVNNGYGGVINGDVERVDEATGNILEVFAAADGVFVGASSAEVVPFTTQLLTRWRTGVYNAGRELRGRTFIPGTTEGVSTNGQPSASFVNSINGLLTPYVASVDVNAAGGLKIWSPTHGTSALVNQASLWNQFAVLRTRRP
jgi:hypothetical protein